MKPRQKRILLWVATVVVALAALVGLAFLATFYYLKPTLPDTAQLRELKLQVPLRVYSRDGRLLGQVGEQRRLPVRYEEIPPIVVQAFLAAEDDRFFSHPGVDWQGMVRATFVSATSLEARQGGSTITQQLVRTTLITKEKTLRRKLREIFLSLTLEHELEKQEILTLYLNTVFLGQRAYGVAAAAETYFGKPLADLNVAEAALLAGLPQAPSRYNPVTSPELATRRRGYVLRRMRELRYIDEPTYQAAGRMPVAREVFGPRIQVDAPYVTELVRIALEARYGERLYSEGIKVVTTIDSQLQRAADVALRSAVLEYDRRHGYRGAAGKVAIAAGADAATVADLLEDYPVVGGLQPAIVTAVRADGLDVITRGRARYHVPFEAMRWARRVGSDGRVGAAPKRPGDVAARGAVVYVLPDSPSTALLVQVPEVQGAFTALDPTDGAILALAGGFDYYAAKFNRVTQARRQPGSAFKPFVYSAALDRGFTPATVILDAPVVFESGEAGDWRPENNEGRFYGPTRMREALVRSRNLVSIRIMRSLGVGYTRDYVQRFGFPAQHLPPDLTMALGTAQLTPLEVATGYATFANGGYRVNPYLIDRVEDANGKVLMQADPLMACRECAPPAPAQFPGGAAGVADAVSAPASPVPAAGPAAAQVASFLGDGAGMTRAVDVGGGLPLPDEKHRAPQVITAANAFVMTDMMRDVIRRGTARRALALNREDIAGKTGTTNDRRDAWFSGFNADLVGTAWIGFDQERSLGDLEEGGRTALPMWIYFMREALRGHPTHRLPMPDGVVTARIRPATGQLADSSDTEATFEYFLADHMPGSGGVEGEGVLGAPDTQKPDEEPIF